MIIHFDIRFPILEVRLAPRKKLLVFCFVIGICVFFLIQVSNFLFALLGLRCLGLVESISFFLLLDYHPFSLTDFATFFLYYYQNSILFIYRLRGLFSLFYFKLLLRKKCFLEILFECVELRLDI